MREPIALNLGTTDFESTWNLQQKLARLRLEGMIPDLLLLNEHRHVFTIGKSGGDDHLLANEAELRTSGADLFHIDRGGDITYHGPGQLVVYPILDLNGYHPDIHRYLRDLEEVVIRTLAVFGIRGMRDPDYTGVWVGSEKIAAVGVKVSRWITMHGFALNVNTDLRFFDRIIPCGIFHKGVTSMERILGERQDIGQIGRTVVSEFGDVFGTRFSEEEPGRFLNMIEHLSMEKSECHQAISQ